MDSQQIALLVGIVVAVVLGVPTARSSAHREPLYGGMLPGLFHYVACCAIAGLPFAVLGTVFTAGLWSAIQVAITFLLVMYTSLFLFAATEHAARAQALAVHDEHGWTEEDARTSGL